MSYVGKVIDKFFDWTSKIEPKCNPLEQSCEGDKSSFTNVAMAAGLVLSAMVPFVVSRLFASGETPDIDLVKFFEGKDVGYASHLHDEWRKTQKVLEGDEKAADGQPMREPRWKKVNPNDPTLASIPDKFKKTEGFDLLRPAEGGQTEYTEVKFEAEVDISNLPFKLLPKKHQAEYLTIARDIINEIAKYSAPTYMTRKDTVVMSLEKEADVLHSRWLGHNRGRELSEKLNRAYEDLPKAEQGSYKRSVADAVDYINKEFEKAGSDIRVVLTKLINGVEYPVVSLRDPQEQKNLENVEKMEPGRVYKFKTYDGRAEEVNYAFKGRDGKLYVVTDLWARNMVACAKSYQGLNINLPEILQVIADTAAVSNVGVDVDGRRELDFLALRETNEIIGMRVLAVPEKNRKFDYRVSNALAKAGLPAEVWGGANEPTEVINFSISVLHEDEDKYLALIYPNIARSVMVRAGILGPIERIRGILSKDNLMRGEVTELKDIIYSMTLPELHDRLLDELDKNLVVAVDPGQSVRNRQTARQLISDYLEEAIVLSNGVLPEKAKESLTVLAATESIRMELGKLVFEAWKVKNGGEERWHTVFDDSYVKDSSGRFFLNDSRMENAINEEWGRLSPSLKKYEEYPGGGISSDGVIVKRVNMAGLTWEVLESLLGIRGVVLAECAKELSGVAISSEVITGILDSDAILNLPSSEYAELWGAKGRLSLKELRALEERLSSAANDMKVDPATRKELEGYAAEVRRVADTHIREGRERAKKL